MAAGEEEEEEVKEEVTRSQKKVEEVEVEAQVELQPWEQHSSVIIIPRYDYNAPSSLLHHSYSGFLITCPSRREKSATKEAIFILEKFIGCNSFLEETDRDDVTKRRKLCSADEESEDTIQIGVIALCLYKPLVNWVRRNWAWALLYQLLFVHLSVTKQSNFQHQPSLQLGTTEEGLTRQMKSVKTS